MRILIITDEVWNDNRYTNNVLTNWFSGFPAEFANIYLATGIPDNPCCRNYLQVTDKMMVKSIVTNEKAGTFFRLGHKDTLCNLRVIEKEDFKEEREIEVNETNFYQFIRTKTTESLRLLKDIVWIRGVYNMELIENFIQEFNPDLIFSLRFASLKTLHFERILSQITNKPMIVFTGDDEYTLKQIRLTPIYWIRRIVIREVLKRNMKRYSKYYMFSDAQAKLYHEKFQIDTSVLMKSGDFSSTFTTKDVGNPIRMIYAGRLYCNRWRTLELIKEALQVINKNGIKMIVEIYTKDNITKSKKEKISDGVQCFLKEAVSAKELKVIYKNADIALHVESFDLKNRLLTKYSFSTKIIDCLASSCAVLAICPKEHSGYQYLKKKRAAICIKNAKQIEPVLQRIVNNPKIVSIYQKRAWECGVENHNKITVQERLLYEFRKIING